jgi:hypothetical protein
MKGRRYAVITPLVVVAMIVTIGVAVAGGLAGLSNTPIVQAASDFWSLTGNAGTTAGTNFLGTTDDEPLELHVNSERALRIEPTDPEVTDDGNTIADAPNLIGGFSGNSVADGVLGATIGGGGLKSFENKVTDDFGTIGGGSENIASNYSTIGGGLNNTGDGVISTVGGGQANTASGIASTVSGGGEDEAGNTASGDWSTVGGGIANEASGQDSTVGGGDGNEASGENSTVSGGTNNKAGGRDSSLGGVTITKPMANARVSLVVEEIQPQGSQVLSVGASSTQLPTTTPL